MKTNQTTFYAAALLVTFVEAVMAQSFDLSWNTIDGGGATATTGGNFTLSGAIGQSDAGGPMTGGNFTLNGGFWPAAAPAGTGVPAATLTGAVSRKSNAAGPGGFCDLALIPGVQSESHQGGITELRLTFNVAPGGPGANPVTLEQSTCAVPAYVPYSGSAILTPSVAGNVLVLTFAPGLENARTYKISVNAGVTSIAGQFVEVSGLVGDVNNDGLVNAADRSVVVGAWTGSGFTCASDVNSSGGTNAADRSIVVGAWTGSQNCAP